MPVVVLLIVLAVIVFLLAKSLQDAKRQQEAGAAPNTSRQARAAAPRPSRQRPRRQPVLDEDALAAHVTKLRKAVETELISVDEAVDSIVRQTDGAVGPEAARKLLRQEDDAA